MIDFTEIRRAIEEILRDEFTLTPIEYENVPLDDPDVEEYISMYCFLDTSKIVSPGVALSSGSVLIQINTPLGIGTERSKVIATELSSILSNRRIGPVETLEAELHSFPMEHTDVYFKQNLLIPYTYGMGNNSC
jgi:hypothetical protein